MNPIVLLICGLPGSGKSTVASRLRDSLISESDGIHNISPVLQYKVGLDASIVCFDDVHRHEVLKDTRSASLALLDSSLSEGACGDEGALSGKITARVIIVDDVMEYGSMRREVYTRARDAKAHYIVVWVRCDLAVALQRDASRVGAAHIGESVIRKIASRFEPMDPKDIWDRNFLEVDSNDPIRLDEGIQQVEYIIMSIIAGRSTQYKLGTRNHDVRPRDIHSSTHDLDNVLRKSISEVIQGLHSTDKARAGSLLSTAKRRVLEDLEYSWDVHSIEPKELLCGALREILAESTSKLISGGNSDLVNNIIIALRKT